jgi:hypothetical protein
MGDTSDDDDTDDATFAAALHFLLHTPHGAGVLRRAFPNGAGSTADIEHLAEMIAAEWRAYAGANDVSADVEPDSLQPWADEIGEADTHKGTASMDATVIAKGIVETGRSWLTEEELTEKIFAHAQLDRRANESPHQAFARHFSANDEQGRAFRKAIAVAKTADVRPVGSDDDDAAQAYRKLERLAEQRRKREPGLSPEQAFAKVFSDPANKALADQAHQRPIAVW